MSELLFLVLVPALAAGAALLLDHAAQWWKAAVATLVSLACFWVSISLFGQTVSFAVPWGGFGFDFALRLYSLSGFLICAISGFALLVSIYSWTFMKDKPQTGWYYFNLLLTLAFANGVVLADNLVLMLFFWEAMMIPLYLFIAFSFNTQGSRATAMKALIISGAADLCLLSGVGIATYLAETSSISAICALQMPLTGWGFAAYGLMMIGALTKAGAVPFHTWIPDAAENAQLPFMAYVPAAIDKLLGVYLMFRLSVDLFPITQSANARLALMSIGALTIVVSVFMSIVQSEYKKLLSYCAIGQVGYMALGIGTGLPAGVAGALLHMINHAIYKSCLFLTAGSVERAAGTTKLSELGGLASKMPVTASCFMVCAAAVSGVPLLNSFFSKELISQGLLKGGHVWFFVIAEIGAVLTVAAVLKLGHAVFFGSRPADKDSVKESPWPMLLPMLALSALCIVFGINGKIPLALFVEPSLAGTFAVPDHHLWGLHINPLFFAVLGVIILAAVSHWYGLRCFGSPVRAADHIRFAPALGRIFALAEARVFDLYEQGMKVVFMLGRGLFVLDRIMDFLVDTLPQALAGFFASLCSKMHSGELPHQLGWALLGFVLFSLALTFGPGVTTP